MRKSLMLLSATLISAPAAAADFSMSNGMSLSSGRYGGTDSTRIASSTTTFRGQSGDWIVSASLPYLRIESGGASNLVVNGTAVAGPANGSGRKSGYGDVEMRVERLLPIPGGEFQGRLTAHAKLPTGARALSTGKMDSGIAFELSRPGRRITPYVSAGYRVNGDGRYMKLRDGWATSVGVIANVGSFTLIASHERSRALIEGPAPSDLFLAAAKPVGKGWSWTVYGSKGLSRGSPNLMVGSALTLNLRSGR